MRLSTSVLSKHRVLDEPAAGARVAMPRDPINQPRALGDVDCSFVNGNVVFASGRELTEALKLEDLPERYLDVVAIRTADADQAWVNGFVAANREPEFKALIVERFQVFALSPDRAAAGPPAGVVRGSLGPRL